MTSFIKDHPSSAIKLGFPKMPSTGVPFENPKPETRNPKP
jgi:hypothetical protein